MTTRDQGSQIDRSRQVDVTRLRRIVANDDRPIAQRTENLSAHLWGEPEGDDA